MPPKRKNKNKPNGFYMYMLERKHEFEAQEGRSLTMGDLVPLAHPGWKAVPEQLKQDYNTRAKQLDKKQKGTSGSDDMAGKLDCTGLYVSERVDGVAQTKARRHAEMTALTSSWPEGNGVCMEKFYIISFESLCEHPEGVYIPVEIGCVEYSLCSGITNEFHMFIDPGQIPMGFRYICKARSERRHNLPIEHFEPATNNYMDVLNKLTQFINPKKSKVYPPMFCEFEKRPEVEGCIRWLYSMIGRGNCLAKIYEMEILFNCLHFHASGNMSSYTQAKDALLTSAFDYFKDTRCDYHEDNETGMDFCALGKAKKNCYVISDSLAKVYDIIPTVKHLPQSDGTPACTILPSTQSTQMRGGQRFSNGFSNVGFNGQPHTLGNSNYTPQAFHPRPQQQQQKQYQQQQQKPVNRQPEPQMRRPASMGKSGKIAGGMAPMRALEMGAGRGTPIQNYGASGKYALPASAPPPSSLPPPLASWHGSTPEGLTTDREQRLETPAAQPFTDTTTANTNSLSSDLAARCTISSGIMPKGIGRGIGRGISRSSVYNGL